uniref:Ig-like domain-containing protein n=1 Tax=Timema poppense TaxID=170557 RepID=A0A7R9CHN1_TIMPO|nr:unnamed protein product [Timema poppensis]
MLATPLTITLTLVINVPVHLTPGMLLPFSQQVFSEQDRRNYLVKNYDWLKRFTAGIPHKFSVSQLDPPLVSLQLGNTLNPDDIKEGDDVYFECNIRANPKEHKIVWLHNLPTQSSNHGLETTIKETTCTGLNGMSQFGSGGLVFQHPPIWWASRGVLVMQNMSSGVILSTHSLVLQGVTRHNGGRYTCMAANARGETTSEPVALRVQYNRTDVFGSMRQTTINYLTPHFPSTNRQCCLGFTADGGSVENLTNLHIGYYPCYSLHKGYSVQSGTRREVELRPRGPRSADNDSSPCDLLVGDSSTQTGRKAIMCRTWGSPVQDVINVPAATFTAMPTIFGSRQLVKAIS